MRLSLPLPPIGEGDAVFDALRKLYPPEWVSKTSDPVKDHGVRLAHDGAVQVLEHTDSSLSAAVTDEAVHRVTFDNPLREVEWKRRRRLFRPDVVHHAHVREWTCSCGADVEPCAHVHAVACALRGKPYNMTTAELIAGNPKRALVDWLTSSASEDDRFGQRLLSEGAHRYGDVEDEIAGACCDSERRSLEPPLLLPEPWVRPSHPLSSFAPSQLVGIAGWKSYDAATRISKDREAILLRSTEAGHLSAFVHGTYHYAVEIWGSDLPTQSSCDCPYATRQAQNAFPRPCKHVIAVALASTGGTACMRPEKYLMRCPREWIEELVLERSADPSQVSFRSHAWFRYGHCNWEQ